MHHTDNQVRPRARVLRLGPIAVVAVMTGCGGSSDSTAPTPPATPLPTPTLTFTLDAAADHYSYSRNLARLTPGITFDIAFRLLEINHAETEGFAHAISFWLFRTSTEPDATPEDGIALSFIWTSDSLYLIKLRTPPDIGYADTGGRADIQIGDQKHFRVSCGADGTLSFTLDGTTLVTLNSRVEARYLFAQVVGMKATFEYAPIGTTATGGAGTGRSTAEPCGPCAVLARP